jgi:7-cyano-7-deazaguanine synthase
LTNTPKRAVVLLSGGLDSTTTLAIAKADGYELYALTVRYGQRHGHEVEAAREIAEHFGVSDHAILDLDLRRFGGSALTGDLPVPKGTPPEDIGSGVPSTYVPARNTIFLSLALAWAETLHAQAIYLGVNALDYSGYPDCRPEYVEAFESLAGLATKDGVEGTGRVRIRAPLIHLTKQEIIQRGVELGVDYALTTSCYDPSEDGAACGQCDACTLRRRGFADSGISDPTRYIADAELPR